MEGPRAVRPEEFATLRALTDAVFRVGMLDEYPQLFNTDNMENIRVCVEEGRCVSHVGMKQDDALLFGCRIQVCCIGGVATFKEFRGQGLASSCFDDAVAKARRDGVDVMIVSGDRNLYRMRGCLHVGGDTAFTLTAETLPLLANGERDSLTVEIMTDSELPLVMDCYRQEPVRFLRPPDDYRFALQGGHVMNRTSDFVVIREGGAFRGYGIVQRPREDGKTRLAEFAGDRHALLAALPSVFRRYHLNELGWQVQRHDALFRSLCEGAGLQGVTVPTSGTIKLINFPQLMERLRPRWEELLGRREADKLSFWQQEERYGILFDQDEFVADRDTMTRILFGTPDGAGGEAITGQEALSDVLRTLLPLPTLWYGLNYV